jgi:hypothetical protein
VVPNSLTDRTRQLAHPTWRRPHGGPHSHGGCRWRCSIERPVGPSGMAATAGGLAVRADCPVASPPWRGEARPLFRADQSAVPTWQEWHRAVLDPTASCLSDMGVYAVARALGVEMLGACLVSPVPGRFPVDRSAGGGRRRPLASWPTALGGDGEAAHFVWQEGPPGIDIGHGNVCTASRPPRGVDGTAGGRASRQGYQLGVKVDG